MTAVTLKLPTSLHQLARKLASDDGISMNQFIMLAVAEKVSVLSTQSYLQERAVGGDRTKFLEALAMVADVEPPDEQDRF